MTDERRRLPSRTSARRGLRLAVLALIALTLLSAGVSFLTYDPVDAAGGAAVNEPTGAAADTGVGAPRVVATVDGVGPGQIVAYDADGRVVYRNDSLTLYHDVDPTPGTDRTVTYVASDVAAVDACAGEACLRNVIERVNLTTGEVTRVYERVHRRNGSTQIHDVDRVNDSTFLVADISYPDRVYMVNVTTGETVWQWRASEAFAPESGGSYPADWTHVNDVEMLPDGRVMVNLRNQDQVVFIEPGEGVQSNWTLGADGKHGVLFEAHNPDYIPESRGGPAVVVADSENNRLVEFQRTDGSWTRSWTWRDTTLQWPRDADRLPSGRTLVADSHGERLLSVRPNGAIAWSKRFPTGSYDVELLGTGDESAGGSSAAQLNLRSRRPSSLVRDGNTSMRGAAVGPSLAATPPVNAALGDGESVGARLAGAAGPAVEYVRYSLVSVVSPRVLHGLLYVLPPWVSPLDVTLALGTGVVGALWAVTAATMRFSLRGRPRSE
ncbi:aryl-sulfate sulfotransferase [Halogeometricum sp. S1BR25-6]|uniref:Aryl-sulfate sulfotransferase n=1 Tax=Halogeometricum salsisoli TaxID=2950536 RepID=A0ABU2GBV0_9EURY|nr:aryl-sulfate sulfotransferase [Halogeometricum sp. S1BR25-6]MDS0298280.1 aryl-sulfate sulfotransferase [Halogeometricum sp. S1BR25-6]